MNVVASDLHWSVRCALCTWGQISGVASREEAIDLGRSHSNEKHPYEWEFRVQGCQQPAEEVERRPRTAPTIPEDWPKNTPALGCRSCGEVSDSITMLNAHTLAVHNRPASVLERTPLTRS
jgi:hypothetical protein